MGAELRDDRGAEFGPLLLVTLLLLSLAACQGASGEESAEADPVFEISNNSAAVLGLRTLSGFVFDSADGETRRGRDGSVELDPGSRVAFRAGASLAVPTERELTFVLHSLSPGAHRGTRTLRLRGSLPWKVEVVGEGLRLAFYPSGVELDVLDVREVMPAGELRPR